MAPMTPATDPVMTPSPSPRWHWLLLILLPVLVYLPSLDAPFTFDDYHNILSNTAITEASPDPVALWRVVRESPLVTRPVAYLSFAVNWMVDGVVGFHIVNLIVHVLTTLVVYRLLCRWLPATAPGAAAALMATLLWSLSPINVQAVTYVVQRMTSLATLGVLLSLLMFLRSWDGGDPGRRRRSIVWGLVLAILAALTKEIAILLPALVILCRWTVHDHGDLTRTLRWRGGLLSAVVATAVMLGLYLFTRGGADVLAVLERQHSYLSIPIADRLWTFPRIVLHYLSLIVWPSPDRLNIDPDFVVSSGPLEPAGTLVAGIILAIIVLGAVLGSRRWPLVTLGILWFVGTLVPEHTVLQLDLIFEHHLYLPGIGFFFLVGVGVARGQSHGWGVARATLAVAAMLVIVSAGVTLKRNLAWRDPVGLWTEATERSPEKWRPPLNLGRTLTRASRDREAEVAYREAWRRAPWLLAAPDELAQLLIEQGRVEEAERIYREAGETVREKSIAWIMVAGLRNMRSDAPGALEALRQAESEAPREPKIPIMIGRILVTLNDLPGAEVAFRRALDLDDDDPEVWREFAGILERQGKVAEANHARVQAQERATDVDGP